MDATVLHIQPGAAEPIYRQIMEQVRRLVAGGQLQPGQELPSVREVSAVHAINPMTVSKAYSQLEAEGLLERRRGKGMAIAARAVEAGSADRRWELLEPGLLAVVRQARELELPAAEVVGRLQRLMQDNPGD